MNSIKEIKFSQKNIVITSEKNFLNFPLKIQKNEYQIDISNLNLIEAVRIAILCSTFCFINNVQKKLHWIVKDEEIKRAISILRLSNIANCTVYQKEKEKELFVS